jgi:uncharacterized iron-regulated protein|tara:strand:- start:589 stop:783 length:195 start_codon:yes stop_codon:yes gene_type:complete
MNKRTVSSAHNRIDTVEKEVIALKTEVRIQFKDLFNRVKRIEAIFIGGTGAVIIMLITVLIKMG